MHEPDTKEAECMACTCPCDEHTEHTHGHQVPPKTCAMCGHEHKNDGRCDCGCHA